MDASAVVADVVAAAAGPGAGAAADAAAVAAVAAASPVTRTHCPYCALQCGMELRPDPSDGTRLQAGGWDAFPVNKGALCQKGATSTDLLNPAARLMAPLLRRSRDAEFETVTWDEALDFAASRI